MCTCMCVLSMLCYHPPPHLYTHLPSPRRCAWRGCCRACTEGTRALRASCPSARCPAPVSKVIDLEMHAGMCAHNRMTFQARTLQNIFIKPVPGLHTIVCMLRRMLAYTCISAGERRCMRRCGQEYIDWHPSKRPCLHTKMQVAMQADRCTWCM